MEKEKFFKKAKLQKNIAIGCLVFAFIAMIGMFGEDSDVKSMFIGSMVIVVTAIIFLTFSRMNMKKAILLAAVTGETNEQAEVEVKVNQSTSNATIPIIGGVFVAFFIVIVIMAMFVDSSEESEENKDNSVVTDETKNEGKPDFGITISEYIENVEGRGISNLEKIQVIENEGEGLTYAYGHGDRLIYIYTRTNGNVYMVAYNDSEFEYGVNQISSGIIDLASDFLVSTEVNMSQNNIYTAIYDCILSTGSGNVYEFDDCNIGYSRTMVKYYETAWIAAK